jgi:hypothetical protein
MTVGPVSTVSGTKTEPVRNFIRYVEEFFEPSPVGSLEHFENVNIAYREYRLISARHVPRNLEYLRDVARHVFPRKVPREIDPIIHVEVDLRYPTYRFVQRLLLVA